MEEDYSQEERAELQAKCIQKYEALQKELVMKALTGEIGTNNEMVKRLENLNDQYLEEMEEYEDCPSDFNPLLIDLFKDAEKEGTNVISISQEYLDMLRQCEEIFAPKAVYKNEEGQVCDEYGTPLSEDGERRVFEVLKGGKED